MTQGKPERDAPERRVRLSLKVKLSLLITSLLVFTIAVVGFSLAHQEQNSLTAEMTKRGLTIAQNLANNAKNPRTRFWPTTI